jgi:hypothetical protein
MKKSHIARLFAIAAAAVGLLVVLAEASYWLSHPRRPGPSAHLALSGLGILLLAAAYLLSDRS